MNIIKYKKDKGNTYLVYFDDIHVSLYDDVIIKYNLLCKKEISKELFDEIVNYNDFLEGYYKSVKYINKKLRTELEIRKYLSKYDIDLNNIDEIIDLLYKNNYLNKEMYIKAYVSDQYNLTNNGPYKVSKDLVNLGYEQDVINEVLLKYDWKDRIQKIVNKKIKLNNKMSNNALKTKICNDIIKLGYEKEDIMLYLDNIILESDYDNLTKELIKIKKKYSNKYSGYDLENKVISYLYKKGFNLEDIKRCYNENKI